MPVCRQVAARLAQSESSGCAALGPAELDHPLTSTADGVARSSQSLGNSLIRAPDDKQTPQSCGDGTGIFEK